MGAARLWRTLSSVFVLAVAVNYLWEMAQCPLFAESSDCGKFWHCFRASLGDGVLVLTILAAGWIALKRSDWFARPGTRGYAVMLAAGLLLGLLVEWVAVHLLGRWEYGPAMPLIPELEVGLVPIAQMVTLPPLVFALAALWIKRPRRRGRERRGAMQSRKPASDGGRGSRS